MANEPYQPISCDFHDVLESLAVQARPAEVVYLGEDGTRHTVSSTIADLFGRDGVEYVRLGTGETIRLDRLVMVDGVRLGDFHDADGG